MNKKPTIYIISNFGGGVRKSTTIAYWYLALSEQKKNPFLVALDTNTVLNLMLPKGIETLTWDINNLDQSQENLRTVIEIATQEDRPIIMDIAALGGQSLGINTLLDTQMLRLCHVVSIVPVMPSAKSIEEGMKALALINPDKWVLVQYDTKMNKQIYDRTEQFKALLDLRPDALVIPAELTDKAIDDLKREPLAVTEMYEEQERDPLGNLGTLIYTALWNNLAPQIKKSVSKTEFVV